MFTVGLTGGIGSGKSTVSRLFSGVGVPVIDTDVIARALTAPGGTAMPFIRNAFGEAVIQADGSLDRAALRRVIFGSEAARRQLEAILHPLIREVVKARLATQPRPYALVVIPLLVETGGYRDLLNRVLVVDCPERLQIERVTARSGLSQDEVKAILAAQASRAERLRCADDVLLNAGEADVLHAQVAALHSDYLRRAAACSP